MRGKKRETHQPTRVSLAGLEHLYAISRANRLWPGELKQSGRRQSLRAFARFLDQFA